MMFSPVYLDGGDVQFIVDSCSLLLAPVTIKSIIVYFQFLF